MEKVTKRLGDWEIVAVPGRGGALAACRYQGVSILREGMNIAEEAGLVTDSAAYPMVPFCGRIENGRFSYDGASYALEPNFSPEPHAIHGTGWQSSWAIDRDKDRLSMVLVDDSLRWPWPFRAEQVFWSDGPLLRLDMSVINIGERPMPAGLGWHPFFERTRLKTLGASLGPVADPVIGMISQESEDKVALFERCLGNAEDLGAGGFDDCFSLLRGRVDLFQSNRSQHQLIVDPNPGYVVLYAPADDDFICFEPVTHVPNAINAASPDTYGVKPLEPGGMATLSIALRHVPAQDQAQS
ncbi:MAG: hypothetical protein AAF829_11720 [Pseudomonadota bacterium]